MPPSPGFVHAIHVNILWKAPELTSATADTQVETERISFGFKLVVTFIVFYAGPQSSHVQRS